MKNRDRAEINAMILDIATHGRVTKTKIMYRAYLSYNKLEEYLTDLGESEAIGIRSWSSNLSYYGKRKTLLRDT